MKKRITYKDVDENIYLAKNRIIDNILMAVLVTGAATAGLVFWRDLEAGIEKKNSLLNFLILAISVVIWFGRKRLSVSTKSIILFILFSAIGFKSIIQFGTFSLGIIFMSFSCLLIVLSFDLKRSIIFSTLLSLIIPIAGYLIFTGYFTKMPDFYELYFSLPQWFSYYAVFLFTGFIIIMSIGQMRKEMNSNFFMLKNSITELEEINEELKTEIELKEAYEQNLIITSQKFKGLFDSIKDGVILLDSDQKIIEANPAILEMVDVTLQEAKQSDIYSFIGDRYRGIIKNNFSQLINGEYQPPLTEVTIFSKSGKRIPVELNTNLIINEDNIMVLSTVRDISYRKELENEKFNAALMAEERERERFSKDLHDDLGPVFSTAKLYLQTLSKKETATEKKQIIEKITTVIESAVKSVREISHNLSPHLLRDVGLIEAIKTHIKRVEENKRVKTELKVNWKEKSRLPSNVEISLYRIFLELLNNTLKHSKADHIDILLSTSGNYLNFQYIDNGGGFDFDEVFEKKQGIGLKNIASRIKALRGTIRYELRAGKLITELNIPL